MAFKFNLESVLKHRQRLEDAAQREFAEAQAAVNAILVEIEAMYRLMDETRIEIQQAQAIGTSEKIESIRAMEDFLVGHRRLIELKRLAARELMNVAEQKQEALIVAAREKKVLQKLKERRALEHREWQNRMETKELDDMTTIRQAWGKK